MKNNRCRINSLLLLSLISLSTPILAAIDERAVLNEYERTVKDAKKAPSVVPTAYPGVRANTEINKAMYDADKRRAKTAGTNVIGASLGKDGTYTLTDSTSIIRQARNQALDSFSSLARDNIVINGNVYGNVYGLFNDSVGSIPGLSSLSK